MKNISILVFEFAVEGLFLFVGLSGKRFFFLEGARSATIALGVVGMLLCTISVGRFISASPAHPLSILGYIFGSIALLAFLAQVFKWNLPFVGKPETALIILALSMAVKVVIARFASLVVK